MSAIIKYEAKSDVSKYLSFINYNKLIIVVGPVKDINNC